MKKLPFLLLSLLFLVGCSYQNSIRPLEKLDDLAYPFQVHKMTILSDVTVAYLDEGKGPHTIVFVHGLGSYAPAWKKQMEGLKNQYRCIAIDLPGYGKSGKGNFDGNMSFYSKVISELSKGLGLKKIVLAGHSMGGQIAMATALQHPELVEKLILFAPAGFETFNKGQKQWFRDVMTVDGVRLTTVEQIRTNMAYNFYKMPKDAGFMIDDRIAMRSARDFTDYCFIIPQNVKGMVDEPVYDFLPQIKQPTLCLFGANDNLIPNRYLNGGKTEKYAKAGASRIPSCTLRILDKTGHFIMFERPEACNEAVRNFLQ